MELNHPVKILLVDDKKENLLSLQVVLADRGYEFVEATSGKDALRILLKSHDFAIILMDVQMPIMDGFETAELIRQSEKLKHVPIIFLTANMNTMEYVFKGYQAGAVDYMIKPLSAEILQAKVAVFAELHRKNQELKHKEEQMQLLNNNVLNANKILQERNLEIEKQAQELRIANKELESFTYISSHDLQEPLRKIQTYISIIKERENLSQNGHYNFDKVWNAADRMRRLIESLLVFSHTKEAERKFEKVNLKAILDDVKSEMEDALVAKQASIDCSDLCEATVIPFQFTQLMYNLISNAIKFSKPDVPPLITVKGRIVSGSDVSHEKLLHDNMYCHIAIADNGIGFSPQFSEKVFDIFQRFHDRDQYSGTGIGLAIVKRIVDNHNGVIVASSSLMEGAKFDIYIPD
ncbi:MAG: hybrid sensor histidine kinase/response regulator [Flavobacterium sp.]|nr:MAG: hybrid sensor histidine kinase/response regulator [Flavobacterium sp.]